MKPTDVLKKIITVGAPVLATALGSPLAGAAIASLSQALFGRKDATIDEIQTELVSNPDSLVKLKQAEYDFKLGMEKLNVDMAALNYADIKDARQMNIQSTGFNKIVPAVLTFIVTIGFFVTLYLLMYRDIDSDAKEPLFILVGILGTVWIGQMNYWFGTSMGSKDKDATIFRMNNATV